MSEFDSKLNISGEEFSLESILAEYKAESFISQDTDRRRTDSRRIVIEAAQEVAAASFEDEPVFETPPVPTPEQEPAEQSAATAEPESEPEAESSPEAEPEAEQEAEAARDRVRAEQRRILTTTGTELDNRAKRLSAN